MARTSTKSTTTKSTDELILQERQVKALEKIPVSLDALTLWFEEIQKDEWDARLQFYLAKWLENMEKEN